MVDTFLRTRSVTSVLPFKAGKVRGEGDLDVTDACVLRPFLSRALIARWLRASEARASCAFGALYSGPMCATDGTKGRADLRLLASITLSLLFIKAIDNNLFVKFISLV